MHAALLFSSGKLRLPHFMPTSFQKPQKALRFMRVGAAARRTAFCPQAAPYFPPRKNLYF